MGISVSVHTWIAGIFSDAYLCLCVSAQGASPPFIQCGPAISCAVFSVFACRSFHGDMAAAGIWCRAGALGGYRPKVFVNPVVIRWNQDNPVPVPYRSAFGTLKGFVGHGAIGGAAFMEVQFSVPAKFVAAGFVMDRGVGRTVNFAVFIDPVIIGEKEFRKDDFCFPQSFDSMEKDFFSASPLFFRHGGQNSGACISEACKKSCRGYEGRKEGGKEAGFLWAFHEG